MYGTFDGVDLLKTFWCHSGPNIICLFVFNANFTAIATIFFLVYYYKFQYPQKL